MNETATHDDQSEGDLEKLDRWMTTEFPKRTLRNHTLDALFKILCVAPVAYCVVILLGL